jgi:hypothetical protein
MARSVSLRLARRTQTGDCRWDGQASILHLPHKGLACAVFLDVDKLVVDALLSEKFFAALAVAAPVSAIELDGGVRHAISLSLF